MLRAAPRLSCSGFAHLRNSIAFGEPIARGRVHPSRHSCTHSPSARSYKRHDAIGELMPFLLCQTPSGRATGPSHGEAQGWSTRGAACVRITTCETEKQLIVYSVSGAVFLFFFVLLCECLSLFARFWGDAQGKIAQAYEAHTPPVPNLENCLIRTRCQHIPMTRCRVIGATRRTQTTQKTITNRIPDPKSTDSLRSPALCHCKHLDARSQCAKYTSPLPCHVSSPRNAQRRSVASHRE